jgi:hypothetical protein
MLDSDIVVLATLGALAAHGHGLAGCGPCEDRHAAALDWWPVSQPAVPMRIRLSVARWSVMLRAAPYKETDMHRIAIFAAVAAVFAGPLGMPASAAKLTTVRGGHEFAGPPGNVVKTGQTFAGSSGTATVGATPQPPPNTGAGSLILVLNPQGHLATEVGRR